MNEETTQVINWDINKAAIAEVAEDFKEIDAYKDHDGAKAAKKTLVKMRGTLTEAHKATKADALAFGRKVDAKKNEYMDLIKVIEDPITKQLDDIKNAAAIEEAARVAKIMEHIERIQAFALDRHSLTIPELKERLTNLREVEIEVPVFEEYSEDAQLAKDEADMKLRLAIDREKQEMAERDAREELERKNKELQDKLDKAEAEQAERDREAQELADKRAEEAKAAADKRQQELDAQQAEIDRQNEERERIAREEQEDLDRQEAEAKEAALIALQAPDVEKLTKYADAIKHLIGLKPVMGSTNGNVVLLNAVNNLINSHAALINDIEEMK